MYITVKLPDINSIILTCRYNHSIVGRVEHCFNNGVRMSDKSLEIIGHRFLSIIVPNFDKVVFTTGEHEATIDG